MTRYFHQFCFPLGEACTLSLVTYDDYLKRTTRNIVSIPLHEKQHRAGLFVRLRLHDIGTIPVVQHTLVRIVCVFLPSGARLVYPGGEGVVAVPLEDIVTVKIPGRETHAARRVQWDQAWRPCIYWNGRGRCGKGTSCVLVMESFFEVAAENEGTSHFRSTMYHNPQYALSCNRLMSHELHWLCRAGLYLQISFEGTLGE